MRGSYLACDAAGWRRGLDSNPRTPFEGNSISSRARYDRFGTSPIGKPTRVIEIGNSPLGAGGAGYLQCRTANVFAGSILGNCNSEMPANAPESVFATESQRHRG